MRNQAELASITVRLQREGVLYLRTFASYRSINPAPLVGTGLVGIVLVGTAQEGAALMGVAWVGAAWAGEVQTGTAPVGAALAGTEPVEMA